MAGKPSWTLGKASGFQSSLFRTAVGLLVAVGASANFLYSNSVKVVLDQKVLVMISALTALLVDKLYSGSGVGLVDWPIEQCGKPGCKSKVGTLKKRSTMFATRKDSLEEEEEDDQPRIVKYQSAFEKNADSDVEEKNGVKGKQLFTDIGGDGPSDEPNTNVAEKNTFEDAEESSRQASLDQDRFSISEKHQSCDASIAPDNLIKDPFSSLPIQSNPQADFVSEQPLCFPVMGYECHQAKSIAQGEISNFARSMQSLPSTILQPVTSINMDEADKINAPGNCSFEGGACKKRYSSSSSMNSNKSIPKSLLLKLEKSCGKDDDQDSSLKVVGPFPAKSYHLCKQCFTFQS